MPSAANAKSEKPASSEATDNSPIRQIMTIIEHKIRNLEKRKSKLQSYRDLQKAGKELHGDQKVAVAKFDEVAQTLEFARDLSKQVTAIAISAEREAKKQAKKDAWVRYAADTQKIREVLLVLDCLVQMGNSEARDDFLNGTNGAAKLTEEDLKILDDLYPEVTPKHESNEEGLPAFQSNSIKAAEHLYAIIDGKPKEMLGTTYTHIKEIVTSIHECGYFDKSDDPNVIIPVPEEEVPAPIIEEEIPEIPAESMPEPSAPAYPPAGLPAPPAPAVVPAPGYPLRPLPPITLQEVEHAYFSQQYPQQRPISEVIGSQNFFFLQESEIDSPVGTPQPPPILNQPSPPAPIPSQTFTNQHYVLPPQPHFAPHPEHGYPAVLAAGLHPAPLAGPQPGPPPALAPQGSPHAAHHAAPPPAPLPAEPPLEAPAADDTKPDDEWKDGQSPEREEGDERKTQGQGDGQARFRRYNRGGGGGGRGASNGYRGRGPFQNRQNSDAYHGRHGSEYQGRSKDGYQGRQYGDNYQGRHQNRGGNDGYYGNGDTGDSNQHSENGGRDRHNDNNQSYQGGFKGRGRGGPRAAPRGSAPRAPRPHPHYARKPDQHVD